MKFRVLTRKWIDIIKCECLPNSNSKCTLRSSRITVLVTYCGFAGSRTTPRRWCSTHVSTARSSNVFDGGTDANTMPTLSLRTLYPTLALRVTALNPFFLLKVFLSVIILALDFLKTAINTRRFLLVTLAGYRTARARSWTWLTHLVTVLILAALKPGIL